jgi:hypothetical protein
MLLWITLYTSLWLCFCRQICLAVFLISRIQSDPFSQNNLRIYKTGAKKNTNNISPTLSTMKYLASIILLLAISIRGDACVDECDALNLSEFCLQNCRDTLSAASEASLIANADDTNKMDVKALNDAADNLSLVADSDEQSAVPEEQESGSRCVSISKTSACAPWSEGLSVDVMELSRVYGRKIETAEEWEAALVSATAGGDLMMAQWRNYAACPRYGGEPLQYARTYNCLTDIHFFSAACKNVVKVCVFY